MSFFDFTGHSLVESLRTFLRQISLEGGINKDKEAVLLHFARRYLECNKGTELADTFQSEGWYYIILMVSDIYLSLAVILLIS